MAKRRAVIETAKEQARSKDRVVTLSTGVRARVLPVSATLIDKAQSKVKDPEPPMFYIEEKGVSEPNYSDPRYISAKNRADVERVVAAMDAMILFGVELVDGLPENDSWKSKLRLMEKMGSIDISDLDLDDDLEAEFAYKRYVATSMQDVALISAMSGIGEEDVAQAESIFRSQEE